MIGKRLRRRRKRPGRDTILRSVVALARYVGRDHHAELEGPPASSAASGVSRLVRYVRGGGSHNEPDRVNAGGAFNLVGSDPAAWEAQLVAAADQCPSRADPLEHYVLSWRESERPTAGQLEDAARTLTRELGLGKCPAVWAAHNDTDNLHLHLAVVRLDLETGRVAALGWDIDKLHQALAIIEHEQGWLQEKKALYRVENGFLLNAESRKPVRDLKSGTSIAPKKRDGDLQKKAVASRLLLALTAINSWELFHAEAATSGIQYVRKGSGARIFARGKSYRASAVHRGLALSALEGKLGPYDGPRGKHGTTYEGYQRSYSNGLDQIRAAQAAARAHLEKVRKDERAKIAALLADASSRAILRAFYQAMEFEFEAARNGLDEAYRKAKKELLQRRLDRAAWIAADEPASIDPVPPPAVLFPTLTRSPPANPAMGATYDIRSADQAPVQFQIDHRYESGNIAFTDHRTLLIVHSKERTAICAALETAQRRWGSACVSGSASFREQCKAFGVELGIEVVDSGEPPPLIGKSKEPDRRAATETASRRSRAEAWLFGLFPDKPSPDVGKAKELASQVPSVKREKSRSDGGLSVDELALRRQGERSNAARTTPVAVSPDPANVQKPDGRPIGDKGKDQTADPSPDLPIMPPRRGGGWER